MKLRMYDRGSYLDIFVDEVAYPTVRIDVREKRYQADYLEFELEELVAVKAPYFPKQGDRFTERAGREFIMTDNGPVNLATGNTHDLNLLEDCKKL